MLSSPRSAGVSVTRRPPWRRSVAASDPVAGVNGARGRLRLSSPPDAVPSGCQHRLFGQGLEASAITASARRNPAAAVAGSERESTSWESGNLGSCRAFADSPGCQDSRFSVPRPGGDLGGRDRRAGSAGAGGDLANWKPGTLGVRAARRGAGRRGPAVARSARVGRTRAAAMAPPMARRRASRVPRGTRLRRVLLGPLDCTFWSPCSGQSIRRLAKAHPLCRARLPVAPSAPQPTSHAPSKPRG